MPETRRGLRESFPETTKCLVNTAQIAFLNKIHSRQLANPQEIRPIAEKFNEFLEFRLRTQHAGLSHPEAIACADQWVHATAKNASPCFLVWPHIS